MRAAIFAGPHSIELADRPDPVVATPTDAVVRVVLSCVCGSDLWYYRGESPHTLGPIGHEFVGVVEQVGAAVRGIAMGDLVIAPFKYSDGTCVHCRAGWTSSCVAGGPFGTDGIDGGQGAAPGVLVVIDEHASFGALGDPVLRGDELGMEPFHALGKLLGEGPDLLLGGAAHDGDVKVYAAGAGGFGKIGNVELIECLMNKQGRFAYLAEGGLDGIEIEVQIIRPLNVVAAGVPGIQIDAA